MYELVYNSISEPQDISDSGLTDILAVARLRNQSLGITGLLLYHRGEFVQLLEGERDAVRQVFYDFILCDRRHTSVNLCWDFEIERRSFPDWSMGFYRPDSKMYGKNASLDGYLEGGVAALELSGPPSTGRQLLFEIYAQIDPAQFAPRAPIRTQADDDGAVNPRGLPPSRKL
jgi:hypothetical protein